jgi:chromosome segregation ATPase
MSDEDGRPESGEDPDEESIRARGEQAVGDLAQALLENPMFNGALSAAFGAREKAVEAQQAAMGALNLPSAAEVERLERRLRSLSHRLESVEEQIDQVARDVGEIRRRLDNDVSVGADQSRLKVEE